MRRINAIVEFVRQSPAGLSTRDIAQFTGTKPTSLSGYLHKLRAAGLLLFVGGGCYSRWTVPEHESSTRAAIRIAIDEDSADPVPVQRWIDARTAPAVKTTAPSSVFAWASKIGEA